MEKMKKFIEDWGIKILYYFADHQYVRPLVGDRFKPEDMIWAKAYVKLLLENIPKPIVTMTEIENAVGDTSDEYTEGVVELFESKGFEVEK